MPGVSFTSPGNGNGPAGNCCPAISIARADMLALIAGSTVKFPRTYIITDPPGAISAEFLSTSTSSIHPNGVAWFWVPNYTVAGLFMGQLTATSVIAVGEKWIWGNAVWRSLTGVIGSLADPWALGADWELLAGSVANGYIEQQFICTYDITNNKFTFLKQFSQVNENQISANLQTLLSIATFDNQWADTDKLIAENYGVIANNRLAISSDNIVGNTAVTRFARYCIVSQNILSGTSTINFNTFNPNNASDYIKGNTLTGSDIEGNHLENAAIADNTEVSGSLISQNKVVESQINTNTLAGESDITQNDLQNAAEMDGNTLAGASFVRSNKLTSGKINLNELDNEASIVYNTLTQGEILSNELPNGAAINTNYVGPTCQINSNIISATPSATPTIPEIAFCKLNDNCQINDNTLSGDGACIWDVVALENCEVNNNTLSGNDAGFNILISDIIQTSFDYLRNNTLSGDDTRIEVIHQLGNSEINNCTLAEDSSKIRQVTMLNSQISTYVLANGSGKTGIENVEMLNFTLINATDINIIDCVFKASPDQQTLDLTAWARDLENICLNGGKGTFSFVHNFTTSPLIAGSSLFYGFVKANSLGTKITWKVEAALTGTAGAELELGIETHDTSWAFAPTLLAAVADGTVNTLSNLVATTASIELAATVGNITGGTIRVFVEYNY